MQKARIPAGLALFVLFGFSGCMVCDSIGAGVAEICDRSVLSVTTADQGIDAFELCQVDPSAACTLRAAIHTANACGGTWTIELGDPDYFVSSFPYEHQGDNAYPPIEAAVTIQGGGAAIAPADVALGRLFAVRGNGSLRMANLHLNGGQAGPNNGGAILNHGSLTLLNVEIDGSGASFGGAIASMPESGATSDQSRVRAIASDIHDNGARQGGGIYSTNAVELENARIERNTAIESGGGIQAVRGRFGSTGSRIGQNTAASGGGLSVGPDAHGSVIETTVIGNRASLDGSGVFVAVGGQLVALSSTFAGQLANLADGGGSAIHARTGATIQLEHVTIVDNQSGPRSASGIHAPNASSVQLRNVIVARSGRANCEVPRFGLAGAGNVFDDETCGVPCDDVAHPLGRCVAVADIGASVEVGLQTIIPPIPQGSFLIDVALPAPATPRDQLRCVRPNGSAADVGAVEFDPDNPWRFCGP